MTSGDTIVAISSAIGAAARMIVRVSGPDALAMARVIAPDIVPSAGAAALEILHIGEFRVKGWAYVFQSPRSYTGEDLVEFHIPGNPLLARHLVHAIVERGARAAEA